MPWIFVLERFPRVGKYRNYNGFPDLVCMLGKPRWHSADTMYLYRRGILLQAKCTQHNRKAIFKPMPRSQFDVRSQNLLLRTRQTNYISKMSLHPISIASEQK